MWGLLTGRLQFRVNIPRPKHCAEASQMLGCRWLPAGVNDTSTCPGFLRYFGVLDKVPLVRCWPALALPVAGHLGGGGSRHRSWGAAWRRPVRIQSITVFRPLFTAFSLTFTFPVAVWSRSDTAREIHCEAGSSWACVLCPPRLVRKPVTLWRVQSCLV